MWKSTVTIKKKKNQFAGGFPITAMMMIAFITMNSGLVPLIEGLCA